MNYTRGGRAKDLNGRFRVLWVPRGVVKGRERTEKKKKMAITHSDVVQNCERRGDGLRGGGRPATMLPGAKQFEFPAPFRTTFAKLFRRDDNGSRRRCKEKNGLIAPKRVRESGCTTSAALTGHSYGYCTSRARHRRKIVLCEPVRVLRRICVISWILLNSYFIFRWHSRVLAFAMKPEESALGRAT